MKLTEVWNMSEANLIKRAGFNPPAKYNVRVSLKNAFEEYHPKKGSGALDNYTGNILNSEAPDNIKKQSTVLLGSIREKADNFKILINDFNFDDESDLATTMFTIINGDTDSDEEDTLRFYDFNTFFDIIIGMISDPTLSKQHEPKPVGFSFKSVKENITEINKSIIPRFQKLANIIK